MHKTLHFYFKIQKQNSLGDNTLSVKGAPPPHTLSLHPLRHGIRSLPPLGHPPALLDQLALLSGVRRVQTPNTKQSSIASSDFLKLSTVSQKRDPDIIDCNFGKD